MKYPHKSIGALAVLCTLSLSCETTVQRKSAPVPDQAEPGFTLARPIWPTGREKEMNLSVGFRTLFDCPGKADTFLRIAGSSIYRIYLNGQFVGHGPARGPHGYYRIDQWPLKNIRRKANVLAIEVAAYNVNSFYLLDQPAFVQAEVVSGGKVLAATAGQTPAPFRASILAHRLQKVQRYSFQRPFIEYYRLQPGFDHWWDLPAGSLAEVKCAVQNEKKLLARRVAYPQFARRNPIRILSRGSFRRNVPTTNIWKDRSLVNIGPQLKGYTEDQLEVVPSLTLQKIRPDSTTPVDKPYQDDQPLRLAENQCAILDIGTNLTGFIGAEITCDKPATICFTFDELLTNDDVDFKRLDCVNALCYELRPGSYKLESIEPYTLRYLKLSVLDGDCSARSICLREYANSQTDKAGFTCSNPDLNKIFEAARQTFRQNAIDIFMDCPSRERAGWLCDSFFTSRVAFDLTGNTTIEKNFFENYLLPPKFAHLPDGMLPMCYPADHYDGVFIPNWSLWFVVELEEYLARSGDRQLIDDLKPKIDALFKYFEKFRNDDGLLEKLESWVFIEWSKANDFVQDVSYPSNMLYAAALAAAGRIYDDQDLTQQAENIRKTIRNQAFDGEFFIDNAVRKDGKLQVTANRTEVCQYFAFFFNVATAQTHPKLWRTLLDDFGPQRKKTNAFPEIHPANAFVGNYLRLELLNRYNAPAKIKEDILGFYLYMAEKTGTLWENVGAEASCNHGFASHVVHSLYRDVLGVSEIDTAKKQVLVNIADVGLDYCEGTIITPHGPLIVKWKIENEKVICKTKAPRGYEVTVKNLRNDNSILQTNRD
ncbi:MAG: hypothetical protein JW720_07855 [Sedimentisphaerales bacterium]|nr:hypothetical protein [Sedimentisphaerales bacterium]